MTVFRLIVLTVICFTLLLGCNSMRRPGFPEPAHDTAALVKHVQANHSLAVMLREHEALQQSSAQKSSPKSAAALQRHRNQIINTQLMVLNFNYNTFLAEVTTRRQVLDLTADLTQIGLGIATAATGSSASKSAIGLVSAGVVGSKASVNTNFFFDQTLLALVAAMNAQRKVVLINIRTKMKMPTEQYSLVQALVDLEEYYLAGTFIGGLQAIQKDAILKGAKLDGDVNGDP
jgi:hypothetical protein